MKKQIIIPEFYENRWTDNYKILFQRCERELGFEVIYTNEPALEQVDLAIIFATPHHNRPVLMVDYLENLPKSTKLIGFMKDIQYYNNKLCETNMQRLFNRYDLIITPYKEMFKIWYPEYQIKAEWFFDWIPHERFSALPFNDNPTMSCLISGAVYGNDYVYQDRINILENCFNQNIPFVHIPPPYNGDHDFIGDKYARLLWGFYCGLTTCSIYRCAVQKYFEIPASGSLMLANVCNDVLDLGLIPGKHFIEINKTFVNKWDAPEIIKNVLRYPNKYNDIRKEGREYILQNHTDLNRFDQLKIALESL